MDEYQEFVLTVRRDINCLSDADRMVRRGAIIKLEKTLISSGKVKELFVKRLFLEDLHKPLFRCFADQTEKCREVSVAMTLQLVDMVSLDELENLLPLLLAALLGRIRTLPFPEQSEELRLEILRLLSHLFSLCKERLAPFAGDIIDGLAKALTDTCPDAKKECCEITKKLAACINGERISRAGAPLIASLLANLRHQQWKVRRATLDCLGSLLALEAPLLAHMEEVLPHLTGLLNDRTSAVRQCLADVLEKWLLEGFTFKEPLVASFDDDGSPSGFKAFEHRILVILLGAAADEDVEQVAPRALGSLERVAAAKHEARKRQAEADFQKEKARYETKMAKLGPDAPKGDAPTGPKEIEVADPFDYDTVRNLLPEPFVTGATPSPLTTTYVHLHMPSVLPQVLGNLTQWTTDIRTAAARLLRVLLVLANRQVAPFLDQVLVHLYKASADDDQPVAAAALQCARMAGAFLDVDLVLGLVGKHLNLKVVEGGAAPAGNGGVGVEELWPQQRTGRQLTRTVQDVASGVKHFTALSIENRRQVYAVLSHLLRPSPPSLTLPELKTVVRFLEEGAHQEELLPWVFGAVQSLLKAAAENSREDWPRIFDMLLRMRSGEECDSASVDSTMDELASLCGRTRRQLYEDHLSTRLSELLRNAECELWEERSPHRHVLETLLRNAGSAASEHIGRLVPVLARQASPEDASVPARIDLLGLTHFLINEEELAEALKAHAPAILLQVLIPNCTWRAGQSNNKIRKGGMVCIHALLQRRLADAASLNAAFTDLLPIVKSALDDSFSPDNRMIACLILSCTLSELQSEISGDQLREVYPELLKRLDDSNDKIRVAVCEALVMFFKCLPPNWSRSLYEYILRTLFVHLDDPNLEIQQGIYAVLETAIDQDFTTFINEARAAAAKSSHPRLCEELSRKAHTLRASSEEGA
mmetsp:Transcript_21120/g.45100  ORF Transcript_21120/g.45100 Transcript_21120/m.45100 type:complete len:933 (+) Transcript_21120:93-2891(+)|eukprot:CAMPEP_0206475618 /NCGR_PEP_ID=MMETSP0324_2-20121206/34198_1 /ASSEMBLY_ACC=CAM_ASM_000836 /TAXON_ID=2866 /ORGANISM="Crypthecodinium cohnii, Strain Seligo" /LENGTH=932 /DNA_ID=CAMNT_0053951033 /DNA_START=17 /DNA_END=2815 /DNA_ORIENTATION=-